MALAWVSAGKYIVMCTHTTSPIAIIKGVYVVLYIMLAGTRKVRGKESSCINVHTS